MGNRIAALNLPSRETNSFFFCSRVVDVGVPSRCTISFCNLVQHSTKGAAQQVFVAYISHPSPKVPKGDSNVPKESKGNRKGIVVKGKLTQISVPFRGSKPVVVAQSTL